MNHVVRAERHAKSTLIAEPFGAGRVQAGAKLLAKRVGEGG